MYSHNRQPMVRRSYTIPMFARHLEVKFADGILGIDLGGMQRQFRLLPSSISHGPIEPGQMSIDWESGEAKGGDGVRTRQYKTERDLLNDRMPENILPALETMVCGAIRWMRTET